MIDITDSAFKYMKDCEWLNNQRKIINQDAWTINLCKTKTRGDSMLHEDQKEFILKQLKSRRKDLLDSKENASFYLAEYGNRLSAILKEIREIDGVMEQLVEDDEDEHE